MEALVELGEMAVKTVVEMASIVFDIIEWAVTSVIASDRKK
jgi:hypothetical protein